jgi:alkylation response protein AidB-like acyl-CoA dehydrogenase
MRFAFTPEQVELRDALRSFCDKECTPERVRDAWAGTDGRTGLWRELVEMGVVGVLAPEAAGGLGGDETDLVLLLEETGRCALAEPVVETAAVAIPLLRDASDPRVAALAAGDLVATAVGLDDELAVWADSCDLLVLLDASGAHAVDGASTTLEPRRSVDGARRLFWVDAETGDDTLAGDAGAASLAQARGALGTAAQLLGLADRMLALTVEYACGREQFGAPIGSFQAVKHHLANARLQLEFARPLTYRAAASVAARDPECAVHVSMAKVYANEAASLTARAALQCHGAIGYTTEYDLHLYLKRTWALVRAWGDTTVHRRAVGRAILDGPDPGSH